MRPYAKTLIVALLAWTPVVAWCAEIIRVPLVAQQVSLDPSGIQDQSSLFVSRQLNCQLVRNRSRQIVNEAAKEIRYLSNREIEFVLDPNARFHNGKKVRAADVVASFHYLQTSRVVLRNIFRWIESVRATDSQHVRIRLKKPQPQFLNYLTAPNNAIFEASFLEKVKKSPNLWKNPSGCGAYKVGRHDSHSILLEPVHAHHPVEFVFAKGGALQSEFHLLPSGIDAPAGSGPFKDVDLFDPYHLFLGLNLRRSPWQDRAARCSTLARIQPKALLDSYGEQAQPATMFFPRGVLGFSEKLDFQKYYKSVAAGNPVPPPTPQSCLAILGVSIAGPHRIAAAQTWFGSQTPVDPQRVKVIENPKNYGQSFVDSHCDALVLGLKSNYLDGYEYLLIFSEEAANFTGFLKPALRDLINESQDLEPSTRAASYQLAAQMIQDECLIAPLATLPTKKILISPRLTIPELGSVPFNETSLAGAQLQ